MNTTFIAYLNPFFFFRYATPKNMHPDKEVDTVADLSVSELEQLGVSALIFDVDNTLCEFKGDGVDESLKEKITELAKNFKLALLSNTSSYERVEELKRYFPIPVVETKIKKPKEGAFQAALNLLDTTPTETAMVGDRILTDIVGANKMGLYSIKVAPLRPETEPLFLRFGRSFERMIAWILRFFIPSR
ncbi:MAG: YqeG family HAD IIIA-type phosphatase [Methanobacteriota archaeon]